MFNFFSIRAKFLSVMGLLLMGCLIVYLLIAVQVFKTDKTELIYDLNRSTVNNLSAEIETEFIGIADKFKVFALLETGKDNANHLTDSLFNDRSNVVHVSFYRQNQTVSLKSYTNQKYLETYGIAPTFFEKDLLLARPIPFNDILKNGEFIWNASVENGVPLIGYGRSVVVEDQNGIPSDHYAVVGYMKPDKALKAIEIVGLSEVFITDSQGNILIHKDFNLLAKNQNIALNKLFKAAAESKVEQGVNTVKDRDGEFLAAYAKSYQGKVYVLARVSQNEAFSVVYDLVSRSASFALIVITLSLLFAFLLSRSLTRPISVLVDGMQKVSEGDLSTQIEVKSNDETKILASSFNQMIHDLRHSRNELETINRELDQKVKDRTVQLEIQNKAVKEAQEALLKTTRLASAGEIAGRAAHEVLNPLTGMLTRLSSMEKRVQNTVVPQLNLMKDILQNWKSDHQDGGFEKLVEVWKQPSQIDQKWDLWSEDIHNLNEVEKNFEHLLRSIDDDTQFLLQESRRISKIINSMRKLSRLNSDVHTYSTRNLLTDCKNIMADLFQQYDINIIEDYDAGADEINIDRDEFIQVATNLLRNSLQAMTNHNREVKNYLKIKSQIQGQSIQIEFCDSGSGILAEHQELLFDKQFTTKSSDDGTGLGLSISRRLIRAHGGDLEFVSSKPFEETVFRLTVPLKSADNQIIKEGAA